MHNDDQYDVFNHTMSFIANDADILRKVSKKWNQWFKTAMSCDKPEHSKYLFLNLYLNTLHHLQHGTNPSSYINTIITQLREYVVQNDVTNPLQTLDKLFTLSPLFVEKGEYVGIAIKYTKHLTQIKYQISDMLYNRLQSTKLNMYVRYDIPDRFILTKDNKAVPSHIHDMMQSLHESVSIDAKRAKAEKLIHEVKKLTPSYLVQIVRYVPELIQDVASQFLAKLSNQHMIQIAQLCPEMADPILSVAASRKSDNNWRDITSLMSKIGKANPEIMDRVISGYKDILSNNNDHPDSERIDRSSAIINMLYDYLSYYMNQSTDIPQEHSESIKAFIINCFKYIKDKSYITTILQHKFCTQHHDMMIDPILDCFGDTIIENLWLLDNIPMLIKPKYIKRLIDVCNKHFSQDGLCDNNTFHFTTKIQAENKKYPPLFHNFINSKSSNTDYANTTYDDFVALYNTYRSLSNNLQPVDDNRYNIIRSFIDYTNREHSRSQQEKKKIKTLIAITKYNNDEARNIYEQYKDKFEEGQLQVLFLQNGLIIPEHCNIDKRTDTIINALCKILKQNASEHMPLIWQQYHELIIKNIEKFINLIFNSQHSLKDEIFTHAQEQIIALLKNTKNPTLYMSSYITNKLPQYLDPLKALLTLDTPLDKYKHHLTLRTHLKNAIIANNEDIIMQILNFVFCTDKASLDCDTALKYLMVTHDTMETCYTRNTFAIKKILSFMCTTDASDTPDQLIIKSLHLNALTCYAVYNPSIFKHYHDITNIEDLTNRRHSLDTEAGRIETYEYKMHDGIEHLILYHLSQTEITFTPNVEQFLLGYEAENTDQHGI